MELYNYQYKTQAMLDSYLDYNKEKVDKNCSQVPIINKIN